MYDNLPYKFTCLVPLIFVNKVLQPCTASVAGFKMIYTPKKALRLK